MEPFTKEYRAVKRNRGYDVQERDVGKHYRGMWCYDTWCLTLFGARFHVARQKRLAKKLARKKEEGNRYIWEL